MGEALFGLIGVVVASIIISGTTYLSMMQSTKLAEQARKYELEDYYRDRRINIIENIITGHEELLIQIFQTFSHLAYEINITDQIDFIEIDNLFKDFSKNIYHLRKVNDESIDRYTVELNSKFTDIMNHIAENKNSITIEIISQFIEDENEIICNCLSAISQYKINIR